MLISRFKCHRVQRMYMFFTSPISPSFNEEWFKCRLCFPRHEVCQVSPKKVERTQTRCFTLSIVFFHDSKHATRPSEKYQASEHFVVLWIFGKKSQDSWENPNVQKETAVTSFFTKLPPKASRLELGSPNNLERFNGSNSGLLPLICAFRREQ